MPVWLSILLVMVGVTLAINPPREGYDWYQALRRPEWLRFHVWIPLLWFGIYLTLYLSALTSWGEAGSLPILVGYGLVLVLLEVYPWLMCRSRRLGLGVGACLLAWSVTLALALAIRGVAPQASLLLLPLLLWAPLQARIDWSLLRLNGPQGSRLRSDRRAGP
jgi:tryptophan-rich sensory protein